MKKTRVGIIGPGNIGTDLMYKVLRSNTLEIAMMAGIVPSVGLSITAAFDIPTTINGFSDIIKQRDIRVAFDASSVAAHLYANASVLEKTGIITTDLAPAAIDPYCVPCVNLNQPKTRRASI